jgi:diadenosine tetraphosphate (Ap4A) HIT family hydrolase
MGYNCEWIYAIIDGQSNTELLIDEKDWCLCENKDKGSDRYLVIFKDTTLKTIRNLTATHWSLLQQVRSRVEQWLREKYGANKFLLFFHYMPSVFQLHLHVAAEVPIYETPRIHLLTQVVENIVKDSNHYTHAVIQTTFDHKMLR